MKVELGKKYHDSVTLFKGTATARVEYTTGLPRAQLDRRTHDGDHIVSQWFDEVRLVRAAEPNEARAVQATETLTNAETEGTTDEKEAGCRPMDPTEMAVEGLREELNSIGRVLEQRSSSPAAITIAAVRAQIAQARALLLKR